MKYNKNQLQFLVIVCWLGNFQKVILKMLSIRDTFFSYRNQVYEGLHETITKTNPQHFILCVGKNKLYTKRYPQIIAKSVANLASAVKSNSHDVSVSNIRARTDNTKLNDRATELNCHLAELCKERNI